jgi:tRNA(fMet)-specific endonuclease VapC
VAYILDTDLMTLLEHESRPQINRLEARIDALPAGEVAVTIVSFQEQVRGWLAYLNRASTEENLLRGYSRLARLLTLYQKRPVLPFDETALRRFLVIKDQVRRVGTMDLRIAATALARGATLLSRNFRDFRKVPGLAVEDWTH